MVVRCLRIRCRIVSVDVDWGGFFSVLCKWDVRKLHECVVPHVFEFLCLLDEFGEHRLSILGFNNRLENSLEQPRCPFLSVVAGKVGSTFVDEAEAQGQGADLLGVSTV